MSPLTLKTSFFLGFCIPTLKTNCNNSTRIKNKNNNKNKNKMLEKNTNTWVASQEAQHFTSLARRIVVS
jgi:hypothetical protein